MLAWVEIVAFVAAAAFLVIKAWRRTRRGSSVAEAPPACPPSDRVTGLTEKALLHARETGALDLIALGITGLPSEVVALEGCLVSLSFSHHGAEGGTAHLAKLPVLKRLAIAGQALSKSDVAVLGNMAACDILDLRACQTVVAVKNSGGAGLCVPEVPCLSSLDSTIHYLQDMFMLSWRKVFRTMLLPLSCAFEA